MSPDFPPPPSARTGWPWHQDAAHPTSSSTFAPDGPRLSIVTPSLNQGPFLEAALRSVLLQGYRDVELIVVDGGSTDQSAAIIAKYEPWLARVVREQDAGPANALNKGFRLATGEILGFLNADDFYLPGAFDAIVREFRARPNADVVSGHGYFAKASGEIGLPVFSDRWHVGRFAYGACVLVQQATFFRKRAFDRVTGFNEQTRTAWDQQLWADFALTGAVFHSIDAFLAAFRLHPGSITGSADLRAQRLSDARAVLEKMRGRREVVGDRLLALLHRLRKFSGHPRRTIRQRFFFHSTLRRWTL